MHMRPMTAGPANLLAAETLTASLLRHALLWGALALTLWFSWVGFIASDDETYTQGALGWLGGFPYIPSHFGTSRVVVSIPMAVMIFMFGEHEWVIPLSTCLYFGLTVSLTFTMLSRVIGNAAALWSSLLLATVPVFALRATIASADLPELFFVAASLWLYVHSKTSERPAARMLCVGLCLGLAFSAHELTLAALIFFGLAFVFSPIVDRRYYWLIGLGFGAVIGIECAYYAAVAGDPLYRFNLLRSAVRYVDRVQVGFGQIAANGTLHIWEPIDPIIMFLTKHEFSLLGWASLPALWWACRRTRAQSSDALSTARIFAGFAGVWILFAAIILRDMILGPRYYMMAAYALFIVVSIWGFTHLKAKRPKALAVGLAAFLFVNLMAIYLDNKNPRFGERALVTLVGQSTEDIYTDPLTADDIHWFCRWQKVDCSRVKAGPPPAGALFYHNPKNTTSANRLANAEQLKRMRPNPHWKLQQSFSEDQRLLGAALERLGLLHQLPTGIARRLNRSNPSTALYRAPAETHASTTAPGAPQPSAATGNDIGMR
jgi:4-amino-4-deoxy-L-arabinose transferase-like glycosyltransferase